jgi:hypothetical protein
MRALLALLVSTCLASAQEGPLFSRHGVGHDTWHAQFYSKLTRDDGGSCCNFNDCRPTSSRTVGDHYEVMVDGKWTRCRPTRLGKWLHRIMARTSARWTRWMSSIPT